MSLTQYKRYVTLEGAPAPDFRLPDQDENWMSLSELTKKGPVMLVFYPGDFTMVCTKQLCTYQESIDEFQKLGIQILGISHNFPKEHQEFKKKYQFSFPLLTDTNRTITRV